MHDDFSQKTFPWYLLTACLGFILMSYELFITRMVAPTVGLSVYTWTAAIGWVLFGISLGSFVGGWLTEKYPKKSLPLIIAALVAASFSLLLGFLAARYGLSLISTTMISSVLVLTCIVSLPFAFIISTITPQIASLVITESTQVGKKYSYISLSHALGSILGVFLTGFFFFEILPLSYSIASLSILLIIIAGILAFMHGTQKKIKLVAVGLFFTCIIIWIAILNSGTCITKASGIFCTDTQYYTTRVVDAPFAKTQGRVLFLDADAHSIGDSNMPISLYQLFTYAPDIFIKNPKHIAMLGAGAYVAPDMLAKKYPTISIDVIDIDAKLMPIAKKLFFKDFQKNINPIISDARWYIAHTETQYDIIIGDVYNSLIAVPFHLTTKEYMQSVKAALTENGVYMFAFINEQQKNKNDLAGAFYATAKSVFPSVQVVALQQDASSVQNIVIIASKSELPKPTQVSSFFGDNIHLKELAPFIVANPDIAFACEKKCILTDDFSPTEKLISKVRQQYFASLVHYLRSVF